MTIYHCLAAQSLSIYEVTTLVDGNFQQVTFSHFATKSGLSTASEGLIFVDQPAGSIDLLKPDGKENAEVEKQKQFSKL
jgi:hypothetical protein